MIKLDCTKIAMWSLHSLLWNNWIRIGDEETWETIYSSTKTLVPENFNSYIRLWK